VNNGGVSVGGANLWIFEKKLPPSSDNQTWQHEDTGKHFHSTIPDIK